MIRIAQVGTFDLDNLGDLLFPYVFNLIICDIAKKFSIEIDIKCFSPVGSSESLFYSDQIKSYPLSKFIEIDQESPFDLIFIGGGDIVRDDDSSLYPIYNKSELDLTFSSLFSLSEDSRRRIVLLSPGTPFDIQQEFKVFLKNTFLRVIQASTRDKQSLKKIKNILPEDAYTEVIPDLVFSLPSYFSCKRAQVNSQELLMQFGIQAGNYICFQSHPNYCPDPSETVRYLLALEKITKLRVVLLEIGKCLGDDILLEKLHTIGGFAYIKNRMNHSPISLMDKVAVIVAAKAFIGSSLHGNILAISYGIPQFCIASELLKIEVLREARPNTNCYKNLSALIENHQDVLNLINNHDYEDNLIQEAGFHDKTKNFISKAITYCFESKSIKMSSFSPEIDHLFKICHKRYLKDTWQLSEETAYLKDCVSNLNTSLNERNTQIEAIFSSTSWRLLTVLKNLIAKAPHLSFVIQKLIQLTYRLLSKLSLIEHHNFTPKIEYAMQVPFSYDIDSTQKSPSLAVICHLFYHQMCEDYKVYLSNIPFNFDIYITTDTEVKKAYIEKSFSDWLKGKVEVRVTVNRGRDIAPKLLTCSDVYPAYEYILHIHSKNSPYSPMHAGWRNYILDTLLGSPRTVSSVFEAFRLNSNLGIIAPRHFKTLKLGISWGRNFKMAQKLAGRMGFDISRKAPIDFPSGSMFWARTAALMPLLNCSLSLQDFPKEKGQKDGTTAHSIERLYFLISEKAGFSWIKISPNILTGDDLGNVVEIDSQIKLNSFFDEYNIKLLNKHSLSALTKITK